MTLTKRNISKSPRVEVLEVLEVPDVVMPDPEAELAAQNPVSYRKGMPPHRVAVQCKCGVVLEMYVDDLESYPADRMQQLFRERGASYEPPICKWCLHQVAKSKKK